MVRNLTRENLIDALKTLAAVAPLTILIWVYAEREQMGSEPDVSISIEVRSSDPNRIVALKKPYPDKVVVAKLEGPQSTLDAVVERLERRSTDQAAVEIQVGSMLEPGMVHEIDTANALRNNPLFKGITIDECQPPQLDVSVDKLEERDLEVQTPAGINNLTGPPVYTPRTVKVRGPQETIDELDSEHKLIAEADLAGFDVMNIPGPHDLPLVRIKPLGDPAISFSPSNVEASVSVRETDQTGTIRSVPIWIDGPPDLMARYHVELTSPVLTNVKVTGPSDQIDAVNRPDFSPKPHALLEIHNDDEPGKPLERVLQFALPPDLRVNEDVSQQKIGFRLVDNHPTE
jgi:hypothetical protein